MMHAELPVAALPVSTKLQTRDELQFGRRLNPTLNYQVPEESSRARREMNRPRHSNNSWAALQT